MKIVGITQKVEIDEREEKDVLDHKWIDFCKACHFTPLILPNNPSIALLLIKKIKIEGLILTGGNTLCTLGGNAIKRDETEIALLKHALKHKIPLIGICRGMQLLQHFFHIPIYKISDHVGKKVRCGVWGRGPLAHADPLRGQHVLQGAALGGLSQQAFLRFDAECHAGTKSAHGKREDPQARRIRMGQQGLYYSYHTFAKALQAYGEETIVTEDEVSHRWAEELARKLLNLQHPDGYWVNSETRWWENNKDLATAYALLALESLMP